MLPQDALLGPLSLEEALMVQSVFWLLGFDLLPISIQKKFIGIIIRALEEMTVISIHSCSNRNWIYRIWLRQSFSYWVPGAKILNQIDN